jgi:hypothetical protein
MSAPCHAASSSIYSIASINQASSPSSANSAASSAIDELIQKKVFTEAEDCFIGNFSKKVPFKTLQDKSASAASAMQPSNDYKKMIGDAQALLTGSTPMTREKLRQIYEIIFSFAGRTSLTPRFCSICLNPGALAKSHIIPNNILSSLGTFFITPRMPNENRTAANVAWKLFCTPKCEVDRLSKLGENGFSTIFHQFIEDVVKARLEGKSASLITTDQSIHYCVASIIFRYIIVNGKRDLQLFINQYGPKVEEAFWHFFFLLRSYVLDRGSADRPHIQLFIKEEELHTQTLITTLCTTYPEKSKRCYTTGHFSFKGFHFLITESLESMKDHANDLRLPSHAFSATIKCEPQTIVVQPEHILTLPYIIERALKFDFVVFQKMLQRVNGSFLAGHNHSSLTPSPRVSLPLHPLVQDPRKLYSQPPLTVRLPDDIHLRVNAEKTGELTFLNSDKYEIVYSQTFSLIQIWFIRNKPAKQVFAVINNFTSNDNIIYGFSFNQELFEKNDFSSLKSALESPDKSALKKILGLIPLSKTDHLGIEFITQSLKNELLIANILKSTDFLRSK